MTYLKFKKNSNLLISQNLLVILVGSAIKLKFVIIKKDGKNETFDFKFRGVQHVLGIVLQPRFR